MSFPLGSKSRGDVGHAKQAVGEVLCHRMTLEAAESVTE